MRDNFVNYHTVIGLIRNVLSNPGFMIFSDFGFENTFLIAPPFCNPVILMCGNPHFDQFCEATSVERTRCLILVFKTDCLVFILGKMYPPEIQYLPIPVMKPIISNTPRLFSLYGFFSLVEECTNTNCATQFVSPEMICRMDANILTTLLTSMISAKIVLY